MATINKEIEIDYISRINSVFEFIDKNLDSGLSLNTLSEIAHFSPYHFHRIFKYITGETLNQYVLRRKIEKAALDILHKDLTISEIAHTYGFSENSSFTRAFKKYFDLSPTEFKKQNPHRHSKIRQMDSKNGQAYPDYEKYICIINELKNWIKMNANFEVREMPQLNLVGLTHIGIYNVEQAFEKLIKWANSKNLMNDSNAKLGRIFYDSIKVTAPDKVRMSIFLVTDQPFETGGEITKLGIEKSRSIVGRFEISPDEFAKSWTGMFLWMNENGYKKSDLNPYEIYHNDYREHPENKFIVDLIIPIE